MSEKSIVLGQGRGQREPQLQCREGGGGPALDLLALPPPPVALQAGPPGGGWERPGTSEGHFSRLRRGPPWRLCGAPHNVNTYTSTQPHAQGSMWTQAHGRLHRSTQYHVGTTHVQVVQSCTPSSMTLQPAAVPALHAQCGVPHPPCPLTQAKTVARAGGARQEPL